MQKHFINGQWEPSDGGQTLPVLDPSTGQAFDELQRGTAGDVDRAVKAARAALSGPWARMTATERGRIPDEDVGADAGPARGTGPAGGARHRQAPEPGAQRHHRGRALLRVLRQRRRQAARRGHPLPGRLPRRGAARTLWRHRAHPALELPGADVRPQHRAGAGHRQLPGAQAVRRRLPDASGLCRHRGRSRAAAGGAERRHGPG
jgi:hypothetical protein